MNIEEIIQLQSISTPVPIIVTYELEQFVVINEWVPISVVKISTSINRSIPIPITKNGVTKGYLVSLTDKKDIEIDSMSDFEFSCFLVEAERANYDDPHYRFEFDYVLIQSDFLLDYHEQFMSNSSIWGGFTHNITGHTTNGPYNKIYSSIELGEQLQTLDSFSIESASRAIHQPFAFERFLKLYHMLELQFDYITVKKIQSLSYPHDINQLGEILSDYQGKELNRLTDLINSKCFDIVRLETVLARIVPFRIIAEEIFVTFGKSNNNQHLPNSTSFNVVMNVGSFSSSALNGNSIPGYSSGNHDEFIRNLCAYWIYRIRCSIAHNKIGEYILTWEKEDFIVEFAEPLIKEVLMQYFKK